MRILVGCESSGRVRDAFTALGHDAWSCDLLPCRRGGRNHLQCDVLSVLNRGWDLAIFHPTCTFLTCSAEWAYKDADYARYPNVGYHQKVKPGTLVGAARREARKRAIEFVFKLRDSGIPKKAIENPKGTLSTRWRKPNQIIQPYDFGNDASKETCLWLDGLPELRPTLRIAPRLIEQNAKIYHRWANQTDGGQNRLSPDENRWAERSLTYEGIAWAMAWTWGGPQTASKPKQRKLFQGE